MTDRAREIAHKHIACGYGWRLRDWAAVDRNHSAECDALTADIVAYGVEVLERARIECELDVDLPNDND